MLFGRNKIFLDKADNIYKIKSLEIINRHLKEEQHLLNDLRHKGKQRSSAVYSFCFDLYIKQIRELTEIYYSSLVEALNIDKKISSSKRNKATIKMKVFINNEFDLKKEKLHKKMAVRGLTNSSLNISYLNHLKNERGKFLNIYQDGITFEIDKINRNLSKNVKWYKSIPAKIFWILSIILVIIQIIESETFKSILNKILK